MRHQSQTPSTWYLILELEEILVHSFFYSVNIYWDLGQRWRINSHWNFSNRETLRNGMRKWSKVQDYKGSSTSNVKQEERDHFYFRFTCVCACVLGIKVKYISCCELCQRLERQCISNKFGKQSLIGQPLNERIQRREERQWKCSPGPNCWSWTFEREKKSLLARAAADAKRRRWENVMDIQTKPSGRSASKEDAHLAEANLDPMVESWDHVGSSHSRGLFLMVIGVPWNVFALVNDRKVTNGVAWRKMELKARKIFRSLTNRETRGNGQDLYQTRQKIANAIHSKVNVLKALGKGLHERSRGEC